MARAAVIVTNTGPVIALHGIGHLHLLTRLSDQLIVPLEVWFELAAKPGAAEPQALSQLGNLSVRPTGKVPPEAAHLDQGEAAAIAHAMSEPAAICLLDDLAARHAAAALGLTVRGTLGLLVEAHRHGHVERLAPLIDGMVENGCRFGSEIVDEVLRRVGER